jgi:hypothetical protein
MVWGGGGSERCSKWVNWRRFRNRFRSHLHWLWVKILLHSDSWPVKTGSIAVSETSSVKSLRTPTKTPKTKKQYSFRDESLKSRKLDLNLKKKLVKSYTWSIDLFVRCWNWILQKLNQKYLENFEMCCRRRMEKIKWQSILRTFLGTRNIFA